MLKTCSKCSTEKALSAFDKKVDGAFGVRAVCKECRKVERAGLPPRKISKEKRAEYNAKYLANETADKKSSRLARMRERRKEVIDDRKAKALVYREARRELLANRARLYYHENSTLMKLAQSEYRSNNRNLIYETQKRWREENREYLKTRSRGAINAMKVARRRVKKLNATPVWANVAAIRKLYDLRDELEASTGIPHHVDHVIPLCHPLVCGLHVAENLQVVPARANMRKSNRFIVE